MVTEVDILRILKESEKSLDKLNSEEKFGRTMEVFLKERLKDVVPEDVLKNYKFNVRKISKDGSTILIEATVKGNKTAPLFLEITQENKCKLRLSPDFKEMVAKDCGFEERHDSVVVTSNSEIQKISKRYVKELRYKNGSLEIHVFGEEEPVVAKLKEEIGQYIIERFSFER